MPESAPVSTGGRSRNGALVNFALAAASGLLIWLSFPPADMGPAAWIALVPWLALISRTSPARAALWSLLMGYGLFAALLHWLRFVGVEGWLSLALYCALYWAGCAALIGWLWRRGAPFCLSVPLIMVGGEFLRAGLFTGFPFYFLGHTQHAFISLIQVADVTGVFGVTFLLGIVNGALADFALARSRPRRARVLALALALALVGVTLLYGWWRDRPAAMRPGPTVCLVQGNVPQSLKHTDSLDESFKMLQRHADLSRRAEGKGADLFVWSETIFPGPLNIAFQSGVLERLASDKEYAEWARFLISCRTELQGCVAGLRTHFLVGAETLDPETGARGNSAYFLSPAGGILDHYDKIHLVIFGEYTPLKRVFPFLKIFRPPVMGPDLVPGRYRVLFSLPMKGAPPLPFGATICYEDTEAPLVRKFVRDGAEFIVNITNDGWFRGSSELDHHLHVCAFRAVENRRPIARCANTGISAIIDPNGRIATVLEREGRTREVEGILVGRLALDGRRTFYTRHGDLFAWLCLGGLAAVVVAFGMRKPPALKAA